MRAALIYLLFVTSAVADATVNSIEFNAAPMNWALYDSSFGSGREPLLVVHPDGTVTIRKDATLDEASKAFWDQLQAMGMKLACPTPSLAAPH